MESQNCQGARYINGNEELCEQQENVDEIPIRCERCCCTPTEFISLDCQHNFCIECLSVIIIKGEGSFVNSSTMDENLTFSRLLQVRCLICIQATLLCEESSRVVESFILQVIAKYEEKQRQGFSFINIQESQSTNKTMPQQMDKNNDQSTAQQPHLESSEQSRPNNSPYMENNTMPVNFSNMGRNHQREDIDNSQQYPRHLQYDEIEDDHTLQQKSNFMESDNHLDYSENAEYSYYNRASTFGVSELMSELRDDTDIGKRTSGSRRISALSYKSAGVKSNTMTSGELQFHQQFQENDNQNVIELITEPCKESERESQCRHVKNGNSAHKNVQQMLPSSQLKSNLSKSSPMMSLTAQGIANGGDFKFVINPSQRRQIVSTLFSNPRLEKNTFYSSGGLLSVNSQAEKIISTEQHSKVREFFPGNEGSSEEAGIEICEIKQQEEQEIDVSQIILCGVHPFEELGLFCQTCDLKLLCIKCIQGGDHSEHSVHSIHGQFQQLLEKMEETSHEINASIELLFVQEKRLKEKGRDCQNKMSVIKQKILSLVKSVNQQITNKEIELLHEAEEMFVKEQQEIIEKLQNLQSKTQTLSEVKNQFKLIASVDSSFDGNANDGQNIFGKSRSIQNQFSEGQKVQLLLFYAECKQLLSNIGIASEKERENLLRDSTQTTAKPEEDLRWKMNHQELQIKEKESKGSINKQKETKFVAFTEQQLNNLRQLQFPSSLHLQLIPQRKSDINQIKHDQFTSSLMPPERTFPQQKTFKFLESLIALQKISQEKPSTNISFFTQPRGREAEPNCVRQFQSESRWLMRGTGPHQNQLEDKTSLQTTKKPSKLREHRLGVNSSEFPFSSQNKKSEVRIGENNQIKINPHLKEVHIFQELQNKSMLRSAFNLISGKEAKSNVQRRENIQCSNLKTAELLVNNENKTRISFLTKVESKSLLQNTDINTDSVKQNKLYPQKEVKDQLLISLASNRANIFQDSSLTQLKKLEIEQQNCQPAYLNIFQSTFSPSSRTSLNKKDQSQFKKCETNIECQGNDDKLYHYNKLICPDKNEVIYAQNDPSTQRFGNQQLLRLNSVIQTSFKEEPQKTSSKQVLRKSIHNSSMKGQQTITNDGNYKYASQNISKTLSPYRKNCLQKSVSISQQCVQPKEKIPISITSSQMSFFTNGSTMATQSGTDTTAVCQSGQRIKQNNSKQLNQQISPSSLVETLRLQREQFDHKKRMIHFGF